MKPRDTHAETAYYQPFNYAKHAASVLGMGALNYVLFLPATDVTNIASSVTRGISTRLTVFMQQQIRQYTVAQGVNSRPHYLIIRRT